MKKLLPNSLSYWTTIPLTKGIPSKFISCSNSFASRTTVYILFWTNIQPYLPLSLPARWIPWLTSFKQDSNSLWLLHLILYPLMRSLFKSYSSIYPFLMFFLLNKNQRWGVSAHAHDQYYKAVLKLYAKEDKAGFAPFYDEYKIGDDNDEVRGPFLEDPKKTRPLFWLRVARFQSNILVLLPSFLIFGGN